MSKPSSPLQSPKLQPRAVTRSPTSQSEPVTLPLPPATQSVNNPTSMPTGSTKGGEAPKTHHVSQPECPLTLPASAVPSNLTGLHERVIFAASLQFALQSVNEQIHEVHQLLMKEINKDTSSDRITFLTAMLRDLRSQQISLTDRLQEYHDEEAQRNRPPWYPMIRIMERYQAQMRQFQHAMEEYIEAPFNAASSHTM
ncbi:hypothetical protein BGW41_000224 [Actinomortierella wolfii]|nr:hypothetical protein BGW41_000224 [Actinomortierella wolfii]